jgi:hypothetical protein
MTQLLLNFVIKRNGNRDEPNMGERRTAVGLYHGTNVTFAAHGEPSVARAARSTRHRSCVAAHDCPLHPLLKAVPRDLRTGAIVRGESNKLLVCSGASALLPLIAA